MKLINATPSPFGRKVAIVMKEKSIPFELEYDVPWNPNTIVGNYSPLQQLPILLTDDGDAIYDSSYIVEWLERKYPTLKLMPESTDAYLRARLLQILGERLMDINTTVLFELQRAAPSQAWLARQTLKLRTGIAELDRLVGDRRVEPSGPLTLGDIAVGTTLTMFDFLVDENIVPKEPGFVWRGQYGALSEYVDLLELRPSFAETRPLMQDVDVKEIVG